MLARQLIRSKSRIGCGGFFAITRRGSGITPIRLLTTIISASDEELLATKTIDSLIITQKQEIHSIQDILTLTDDIKAGKIDLWDKKEIYHKNAPPLKFPFGLWFRGQECLQWGLVPSIYRLGAQKTFLDETSISRIYCLSTHPGAENHESAIEWLSLMQHHRTPSRLLDWTESLLIGTYFAVANPMHDHEDGVLWILNAHRLNLQTNISNNPIGIADPRCFNVVVRSEMAFVNDRDALLKRNAILMCDEFDTPSTKEKRILFRNKAIVDKLAMPIAVYPKRLSQRLKAQSGVFTVFGGKAYYDGKKYGAKSLPKYKGLTWLAENTKEPAQTFLQCTIIPKEYKARIRQKLFEIGIHQASVYAELDDVAPYMKEQWGHKIPDRHKKPRVTK